MIRKSIINKINRFAKKENVKVIFIDEPEVVYYRGYRFNHIKFKTTGGEYLYSEMECNKRHWYIV